VVAIVLASTGAYAVIAYATASRAREFAIRTALGARNSDVVRLVLQRGVRLVASGLAFGLVGTLGATPVLQDLPVTVRPPDPMILVPVGVLLTMLALVACFVPARRAARVDPMSVLRSE
jgi:ABC-type antimicrobial peptide transport system permease subunit